MCASVQVQYQIYLGDCSDSTNGTSSGVINPGGIYVNSRILMYLHSFQAILSKSVIRFLISYFFFLNRESKQYHLLFF